VDNDYYINLEEYPLQKFKDELKKSELLPSRKILKDNIEENFKVLEDNGISNLQELIDSLKTAKKTKELAQKSVIPSEYLLILRREVNSYIPKPVSLEKFPGIKKDTISKLNTIGIKNTAHLFHMVKNAEDRKELSIQTGINENEIMDLTRLTDLSRVKWIGPVFARIFLESGTNSVEKLSKADYNDLYKKLLQINNEKGYTRAKFIENDVKLCIEVSKMVPKVIDYG